LRPIAGTGPGGWADSRRTRKFPSSRAAVSYTWGARSAPSPRSPGRGSRGFATWKRLAPELSKIEISEGLALEDARPAALRRGHPRQPRVLPTITLRLARAQRTERPRTGMAPARRGGLSAACASVDSAAPIAPICAAGDGSRTRRWSAERADLTLLTGTRRARPEPRPPARLTPSNQRLATARPRHD
jgi:hypothetical protein